MIIFTATRIQSEVAPKDAINAPIYIALFPQLSDGKMPNSMQPSFSAATASAKRTLSFSSLLLSSLT
jgi:hypothetical protein